MEREGRGSVVLRGTADRGHLLTQTPPPSQCFGVSFLAFTFLPYLWSGRAGRKIPVKKGPEDYFQ